LNFQTWRAAFLIRPSLTAWLPSALAFYASSTIRQADDQLGFDRLWPRFCTLGAWLLWSFERGVAKPTRKSQDNPGNPYFCGAKVVKLQRDSKSSMADDRYGQGVPRNRAARIKPAASGIQGIPESRGRIRDLKRQEIARG
jgi:hypothetical protein